jgi:DNA-binding PadR family transcriptional regulator
MAAGRPSNPLALAVLTLLFERPMHPYQMSTTLRERHKEASIKINYGSLYSVVESLQKRGFIDAQETVREGRRPERTVYAITDAGQRLMREWLAELLSMPVKEFPQFEAALSLMPGLPPDEVIELLEQRLATLREQYDAGKRQMDGVLAVGMPRLFGVEHEYELALLSTEIEFVDELLTDLRAGAFGGLGGWRRHHELRAAGLSNDEIEKTIRDEFKEDYTWLEKFSQSKA